eukprot:gene8279-19705_t
MLPPMQETTVELDDFGSPLSELRSGTEAQTGYWMDR